MADEVRISVSLSLSNGNLSDSRTRNNVKRDQTAARCAAGVQTVGTTEELLDVGDVATPTECWIQNLDGTNYVTIGVKPASTYYPLIRLKASSEPQAFVIEPGVSAYIKADTSACDVDRLILDA